jgi:hypothetical protein
MPDLLRIPKDFHSIDDVLGCAAKLDLQNIIVLSERENGDLVVLSACDLTLAHCNWLIDRFKTLMLEGATHS